MIEDVQEIVRFLVALLITMIGFVILTLLLIGMCLGISHLFFIN